MVGEPGELECVGTLFADDFKDCVLSDLCLEVFDRGAGDGAVVWATESAVCGDDECELGCIWVWLVQEGVALADAGVAELGDEPEDGFGVGARSDRIGLCAGELGGGDHLHRARDALDVVDGVHAFLDILCITHGSRW